VNEDKFRYEFVELAQIGHEDCLERLSIMAQGRLRAYIYRVTLDHDLTEDLVQESLLEMVKSLKKLRNVRRFWPWLYRIAQSKTQQHFREKMKKPTLQASVFDEDFLSRNQSGRHKDALQKLVQKEMSHKVLAAISDLKYRHRAVLSLRCFEQMPYSDIAMALECNELGARILFFRAKQALKKLLVHQGLGKGTLLTSLGLFGLLTESVEAVEGAAGSAPGAHITAAAEAATETAATEAAVVGGGSVATMAITAAITKVGAVAVIIGAAGTKVGIAVISVLLGLGTVGSVMVFSGNGLPKRVEVNNIHYTVQSKSSDPSVAKSLSKGAYEQWYYFPDGIDGPVFKRMLRWDAKQEKTLCSWLENGQGNYYYHSGTKTVFIWNYNLYRSSVSVRRLPSDTPEFTAFLDEVEGETAGVKYQRDERTGLLTEKIDDRFIDARHFKTQYEYNSLSPADFEYDNWMPNATIVDKRDAMHRRGWCWFYVRGEIGGLPVRGWGRIPFVYDTYKKNSPWLKLEIGNNQQIVDCPDGACLYGRNGQVIAGYPAGSFLKGLARPWMGYHTVDMVRRDAAEKQIWFKTDLSANYEKARVTLTDKTDTTGTKIIYDINLNKDLIEKITFSGPNSGEMEFVYLERSDKPGKDYTEPKLPENFSITEQEGPGMLWLMRLATNE